MTDRGNRQPFVGSGRAIEGGKLGTHKQDFNAHVQGNGYKHTAEDITLNPAVLTGSSIVQDTLAQLAKIGNFVTIANVGIMADYHVGSDETPTLESAFTSAFADSKLTNGGWILLKAGEYSVTTTVTVPAGVSITGEPGNCTFISGNSSELSMFAIKQGSTQINIDTSLTPGLFSSPKESTKFVNLILADSYGTSVPSMASVPMIICDITSHFECDNVSFLGKVGLSTRTLNAIGYDDVVPNVGTILNVNNCYFDGVQVAIDFAASGSKKDFLTVTNCKARTYGTVAASTSDKNCFVNFTLCNASFSNNYHIGAGTYVSYCFNLTSALDIVPDDGYRISVVGNSGGPYVGNNGVIVYAPSGTAFEGVISGNNWGNNRNGEWFITVGGMSLSSGEIIPGDFNGSAAIDILLRNELRTSTVIVNPGTYILTGATDKTTSNLKFIGNKKGKEYPIFSLASADATTDYIGNKYISLGNHIESIQFSSHWNASYNSLHVGFDVTTKVTEESGHTLSVIDCIFVNCALVGRNISDSPTGIDTNPAKTNVVVKDCHFLQDGDAADNISILLPPANNVLVENCIFRDHGYVGGIGTCTGYVHTSLAYKNFTVRNCTMSLAEVNDAISAISKIAGFEHYFFINEPTAKVSIENCQVVCSEGLAAATPISSSVLSGYYCISKFIYVSARDINIYNCLFNGVLQKFKSGSAYYAIPTLFLQPYCSVTYNNNKTYCGALPLQISGANVLSYNFYGSISITNSHFNDNNVQSDMMTLLDIDVDSFGLHNITLNNNYFQQDSITDGYYYVKHYNQTEEYDTQGIVQIYAPGCDVSVNNNNIRGTLITNNQNIKYAGLFVDNYNSTAVADGLSTKKINISSNMIYSKSDCDFNDAAGSCECVELIGSDIMVNGNQMQMDSQVVTGGYTSAINCLLVNNLPNNTNLYSQGIVSGNIFSRRDVDGLATVLRNGYVKIASTSGSSGMVVDNSFSDTTVDDVSDYTLVNNDGYWITDRNKNQICSHIFTIAEGTITLSILTDNKNIIASGIGAANVNFSTFAYGDAFLKDIVVSYDVADAGTMVMEWAIDLFSVIPHGVKIKQISYDWVTTKPITTPQTVENIEMILTSAAGTDDDMFVINAASGTRTIDVVDRPVVPSLLYDHYVNADTVPQLILKVFVSDNADSFLVGITNFKITYQW